MAEAEKKAREQAEPKVEVKLEPLPPVQEVKPEDYTRSDGHGTVLGSQNDDLLFANRNPRIYGGKL